ncbi:MAG: hypothetical protein ACXVHX_02265 [Solirubrobacteraceae bacterium]
MRRAADSKRPVTWLTGTAMICASLVLSVVSVALGQHNAWVLLALGAIVGAVGIGAETGLQVLAVRLALRRIPTASPDDNAEGA